MHQFVLLGLRYKAHVGIRADEKGFESVALWGGVGTDRFYSALLGRLARFQCIDVL
jgi:hypothetical protein